ncbi:MAG TPA: MaoC family dehydratase [Ktedonobacterales bacterium]|nr:MaoC family dehydratase [Ktedonobacterales bacterium]
MSTRYFEDFHVGDTYELGETAQITAEEIIAFARQFDPQPFHLDAEQAKDSLFGQLVASGWHTVSLLMRLLVDGFLSHTISMGSPGVDEVRWLRPLRPGDTMHARFIVLEATPSKSRPTMGVVRSKCEAFNQDGELILTLVGIHFVGRRPS